MHVDIRNIFKAFETGKPVLRDVSFSVGEGEFVSLLGASGCGKSTLLRIIAGLEFPDSGEVWIGGKNVVRESPKERDIAMVFQNYALYPHLSVAENIGMGLKLRGFSKPEIARRVEDCAARLGLSQLLERRPAALSGGQRQRVALARALVRQPKVFLLDEPLSNLDAVLREKTRGELKLLFRSVKGTVIYVTHDQVEAMTLSDRIVVLNEGRIEQNGSPQEIYRLPANTFVASFLGAPPMNLIPERQAQATGLVAESGQERLIGIRPEDVSLSTQAQKGFQEVSVTLAEPTGASTILALGGVCPLRALVSGDWDRTQTKAWISLPASRLHYFDPITKKRL